MGGIWEVNMNWGILKNRVLGLGPEPFERRSVLVCQWCRALVVLVALMAVSSLVAPESFAAPDKMASKTAAAKAAPAGAVGAKKAVPANKTAAKPASKTVAKAAVNPKDPKKVVPAAPKVPAVKKAMASAKSYTERMQELEKKAAPKKKKTIRIRKQVVDGKVCVWGRTAEDAEMGASEAVRKFVGKKADFKVKDSAFVSDSPKYICMVRFNYTDEMPDTWCLETEMVTGFGRTKERAFSDAMLRASARVKNMQKHAESKNAKWTTKNSTEMGFIPYDFVFAQIGKECYCKVFFRYLMPR